MKSTHHARNLAFAALLGLAVSAASCGALPTSPVQMDPANGGAAGTAVTLISDEGTPGGGPGDSTTEPSPIVIGGGVTGTGAHGRGHAWGRGKH
ncbi:MAG TPA: hypothetical protein VL332_08335 [Candidatus Saccharimonadaceae bacterium]|jgi:hypothetical protein|nr:hypothetical protein [Candidatus Saccharimonadaceae bacterium]